MTKSRMPWSESEIASLHSLYANSKTKDIATMIGRTAASVQQRAQALGLKKSQEFLASPAAGRLQNGHTTWNKSAAYVAGGRSTETQFKPGARPHTWKPIGSERMMDGYLQRKVTDTGDSIRDFVSVHVLVWQEHNGPIPSGHIVVFKDRNRANAVIGNLECISRSTLMRRNAYQNLPKELAQLIQLRGVLNHQINKRSQA